MTISFKDYEYHNPEPLLPAVRQFLLTLAKLLRLEVSTC
jgi:hypothetical protein